MCLKKGHLVDQCDKKCRSCNRKHRQSICARIDEPPGDQRRPNGNDISRETPNEHYNCDVYYQGNCAFANSKLHGNQRVEFYSCACAFRQRKSAIVWLLGCNFMPKFKACQFLKSTHQPLGGHELPKTKIQCHITVFTNTKSQELELYAVNFPVIYSPLPSRVNVANYIPSEGLELADNFDDTRAIDVLIGSDYYWRSGSDRSLQQIWIVVVWTNVRPVI